MVTKANSAWADWFEIFGALLSSLALVILLSILWSVLIYLPLEIKVEDSIVPIFFGIAFSGFISILVGHNYLSMLSPNPEVARKARRSLRYFLVAGVEVEIGLGFLLIPIFTEYSLPKAVIFSLILFCVLGFLHVKGVLVSISSRRH